ncbi:MAG: hypothetical protein ACREMJ_10995 [Gemmatimonadales bacterium]
MRPTPLFVAIVLAGGATPLVAQSAADSAAIRLWELKPQSR